MELTQEQRERYSRHITLKDVGLSGQIKLLESKILIVGAGGLGSPAALYLAAAGVGTLGIADADEVDLSNLQRQVIHSVKDIGRNKTDSAADRIRALNPDVRVNALQLRVTPENVDALIKDYDFILDCTDNFASKYLLNDACVQAGKPFCHAGILRYSGQLMTYVPGQGPCLRCVFGDPPPEGSSPTCRETGILGAVPGVIGCLQAMEAIKYVAGTGELLTGSLLMYDALHQEFQKLPVRRDRKCPVCSDRRTVITS